MQISSKFKQKILGSFMAFAFVGAGFFVSASPALAGVGGSVVPDYPTPVTVGTSVPATLTITNSSTLANSGENVSVSDISHTPSCSSTASTPCQPANIDLGVFTVHNGTGRVGTACAATVFTASAPNATGAVTFTPNIPVVLGAATGPLAAAQCIIDFTVDVLKLPTKDASVGLPGVQTDELGSAQFLGQTSLIEGGGSGSTQTTVIQAQPTLSTIPTPANAAIGTTLNDTATLTGGINPTGSVTFKLYAPADITCVAPVATEVDATAPYATTIGFVSNAAGVWHWSADYAGDANNMATSSGCMAEPVNVVDANIQISPLQDTNPINHNHVLTAHVNVNPGTGFVNAPAGTSVTVSIVSGPGALTPISGICATVAATGECTVTLTSPVTGTTVINAATSVVVGGVTLNRATGDSNVGDSPNANKNWVAGNIIVRKITNPASDTTTVFTFTNTGAGYNGGFTLVGGAQNDSGPLAAGTYTVAEAPVVGWTSDGGVCDGQGNTPANINLLAGATVTCTFTNTQASNLIVQKTTVPAGDLTVFTINTTGTGTITGGGAGTITDALDKSYVVTAGTYNVAETVPAGWVKTGDTCQGVVVAAGETKTCLITNTKNGHLIVEKTTLPTTNPTLFTINTTGTGNIVGGGGGTISDTTDKNYEVAPGTYNVAETVPAGWEKTGDTCQGVVVAAGQTVTCTITNTLQKGHLIVQKTTLPAGDLTVFNINASGTGVIDVSPAGTITDALDHDYSVTAGTYSVAETVPAGWDKTGDTCQNVVVAPGQTATCLITNTKRGHLIVDKITIPAGSLVVFNINATGGTVTGGGAGTVTDALNKDYEVTPGTYAVSETVPSGWNITSNTCNNVSVAPGETKTCTITNSQVVQYCSPGYWKQPHHFDSYVTYNPNDLFNTVFGVNAFPGKTLVQVLSTGGGGLDAYGRKTVGALLNASALNSGLTPAQVIAEFVSVYNAAPSGKSANSYYGGASPSFTAPEMCPLN